MREYKLPINKRILLTIASVGLFFVIISTYLKIIDKNYSELLLGIALLFQIIPQIIVLIDIIRNQLHNKLMWLVGMFTFGPLATIIYLLNREKHLRLYKRFENI
ncbi:hypothetical protein BPO_2401 [Bergeyella porcorum]|uniref:Cardiolipin synthase N-terminal domain-containing protein n=1 Tax=Bergeyella porcorum TaxID=1735111 RepID=A0AAU0F6K6_9FLAO